MTVRITEEVRSRRGVFRINDGHRDVVDAMCRYIRSHVTSDLSLDALAARAGYSRSHFSRMFVRVKGKTVQAYVTHARIDGAAAMLRDTDFTVDTIIRHVGYRSSTSFVAAFRARTGMNPARYRHVAREEQTARQRRAQEELQE